MADRDTPYTYDVVVLGTGAAGLTAALPCPTGGPAGRSGRACSSASSPAVTRLAPRRWSRTKVSLRPQVPTTGGPR